MKEKIEKIKAIDALDWFYKNICLQLCDREGVKKKDCHEKMRKIITDFEDYIVTYGQFIYSMRIKNKVCDLSDEEFKRKENGKDNKQREHFVQPKTKKCSFCGIGFVPRKPFYTYCDRCASRLYKEFRTEKEIQEMEMFGEPEYRFRCYDCGEYFEEKPHWVLLPIGWKPFCEDCYYDRPWESGYDEEGAPTEEGKKEYDKYLHEIYEEWGKGEDWEGLELLLEQLKEKEIRKSLKKIQEGQELTTLINKQDLLYKILITPAAFSFLKNLESIHGGNISFESSFKKLAKSSNIRVEKYNISPNLYYWETGVVISCRYLHFYAFLEFEERKRIKLGIFYLHQEERKQRIILSVEEL